MMPSKSIISFCDNLSNQFQNHSSVHNKWNPKWEMKIVHFISQFAFHRIAQLVHVYCKINRMTSYWRNGSILPWNGQWKENYACLKPFCQDIIWFRFYCHYAIIILWNPPDEMRHKKQMLVGEHENGMSIVMSGEPANETLIW